MNTSLVQLTLAFPVVLEEQLLGELRELDPDLPGFTILRAQGHGHGYAHASIREQVRGRTERGLMQLVMAADRAEALIAGLGVRLPVVEIAYWITPVLGFGRLGK
ncbi:MAG: DUF3240 family protein [Gammaproteobacteria bacterium]|nr:DUF3240 family protein [Gammaproteobacteria bacterium]MBK7169083.1 DUF3240 family protein [Gammaproteobacteria bacterium]MBK7520071.1 DUF3240 family protein [Gammaproteobacteria bacterium]MBK7730668.1 DUF3240 family protein [Gammaproteobacteria bacterium]MBK8306213.1 DUF3240 family protein [Gammaproteobacteria bacterium]